MYIFRAICSASLAVRLLRMLGCTGEERSGLPRREILIGELDGVVRTGGVSCSSSDDDGSGTTTEGLRRLFLAPGEVEGRDPDVSTGL